MKLKVALTGLAAAFILTGWYLPDPGKTEGFPLLKGPYLGQKPPGMTPEIFAPGIVSREGGEFNSAFSPDGNEFYFSTSDKKKKKDQIMWMRRVDGVWTAPEVAPFSGVHDDCDVSVSRDGRRLFFISSGRILPGENLPTRRNYMWYVDRTENGWGEPRLVDYPGNRGGVYPVTTDNGTLYFSSRLEENFGKGDVYRCRLVNGKYAAPENLGGAVNSPHGESDAFVAADESFIIVTCWDRPGNIGGSKSDLYIGFRRRDGSWSALQNMGPLINTDEIEFCPALSPDGKYFFFSRYLAGESYDVHACNILWVDAKILKRYKPKESE